MKQLILKLLFAFLSVSVAVPLWAQTSELEKIHPSSYVPQYPIAVGLTNTTVLVFPFKIVTKGVDLGSTDIIASPLQGVDNILRIKAAKEDFAPTNATVVTTDGKIYSFRVTFSQYPDDRPIDLGKQETVEKTKSILTSQKLGDEQIKQETNVILSSKPFLKKPKTVSYDVRLALNGIYTKEDVLFFRLELKNDSPMDYLIDFTRFYTQDRKRLKRTADQESECKTVGIFPESNGIIKAGATNTIIVAFHRFTIADHKDLVIQFFEKDGDRHLKLKINGKTLMKAHGL
ncbi:conjugative transposon protein TraN [Rhizosphaericola mali]|uniref:Conjugative transposon protein TraN n=1 Tax=Rhizosphaericola mali TaxID=2545455 RepID=A0A5P2G346_9BACT|nr:conjugative transposon protein TraN [Rhizosphaericola mali]QES88549.1 conjugative transposon protein TraN [Rhizosphaericola mali]